MKIFWIIFCLVLPVQVMGAEVDQQYLAVEQELLTLQSRAGVYLNLFEAKDPKARSGLGSNQRKLRAQYLAVKDRFTFWQKVYELREALLAQYRLVQADTDEVRTQADKLALKLIQGTKHLKKNYHINSFPLVHNLLIDLKLKKRGACKHWAEDLLAVIDQVDHPNFVAYWGEAHPGTMREHNVAVLVPKGAKFENGVLIDPWRTAGKPFWRVVKDDAYPWQIWPGYEPR